MHLPFPRSTSFAAAFMLSVTLVATGCTSGGSAGSSGAASSPVASVVGPVGSASYLPVPVSSEFGVGQNRVVFGLLDAKGENSAAAPDRSLSISYQGPNGATIPASPAEFVWAIEGQKGVYVGHANFTTPGAWTATFTSEAPGSPAATTSFSLDVKDRVNVIAPGEAAPSVKTPTLADVGGDVAKISSDPTPEKRFYETSEADALAAHKPFVLIFATPKFCQTATCGPTLDKLKPVAKAHAEMTFINVEPYKLEFTNGSLQPVLTNNQLTPVEATLAFKLQTEPYVFVVGADGKVTASFELVFAPDEIDAAIRAVEAS